eukprot:TRINITY_DN4408_c0_g1_i8.p2 TRINITY_DN4408_c0_g1~~TRINITY_DN4408_c0_g1_i8.p2  ORF type:complete len:370 (+),score=73.72 TRINITY_DN4408_c0_g1_i8:54-1163(+)
MHFLWKSIRHSNHITRFNPKRSFSSSSSVIPNQKVRVLISHTTDPYINLATEDWIFSEGDFNKQTLFLWRNEPTVVIGRNQNPWKECDVHQLERDNVHLVRRSSGGGAVYHDLGNSCFSFFSHSKRYNKKNNAQIICNGIKHFGVEAKPNERNDILVNQHKISGSAYRLSGEKCLHHGTLLISTHLHNLERYLYVAKQFMQSKGVSSIRSKVENLKYYQPNINHDNLSKAITESFLEFYNDDCQVETLEEESLLKIPALALNVEKLKSWNWKFGETPSFDHRLENQFDWGKIVLHVFTKDGIVQNVTMSGEGLLKEVFVEVSKAMEGTTYDKMGIISSLDYARKELELHTERELAGRLLELEQWLLSAL